MYKMTNIIGPSIVVTYQTTHPKILLHLYDNVNVIVFIHLIDGEKHMSMIST